MTLVDASACAYPYQPLFFVVDRDRVCYASHRKMPCEVYASFLSDAIVVDAHELKQVMPDFFKGV